MTPVLKRTASRIWRPQYAGFLASASSIHVPDTFEMYGILGAASVISLTALTKGPTAPSIRPE